METRMDVSLKSNLAKAAEEILADLKKSSGGTAVLALHGDLGAGKTTFVQTLANLLGITETVTSPTFVIMKKYETKDDRFRSLVHIDAYRLESAEELKNLRFEDELNGANNLICIEWAEKVSELLPEGVINLRFDLEGEKRTLTINEKD